MWHGGGLDKAGRTRGFQLWIALPPELELGPTISIYQAREDAPQDGPARVLLGSYGSASSVMVTPLPINYLAVRLKGGERWRYEPPTGHTVLWTAVQRALHRISDSRGRVRKPGRHNRRNPQASGRCQGEARVRGFGGLSRGYARWRGVPALSRGASRQQRSGAQPYHLQHRRRPPWLDRRPHVVDSRYDSGAGALHAAVSDVSG
jgi:hypothetical protein